MAQIIKNKIENFKGLSIILDILTDFFHSIHTMTSTFTLNNMSSKLTDIEKENKRKARVAEYERKLNNKRRRKTQLCRQFEQEKKCDNKHCSFAHGKAELSKMICAFNGTNKGCGYGDRCTFDHTYDKYGMLRKVCPHADMNSTYCPVIPNCKDNHPIVLYFEDFSSDEEDDEEADDHSMCSTRTQHIIEEDPEIKLLNEMLDAYNKQMEMDNLAYSLKTATLEHRTDSDDAVSDISDEFYY
jgi:hypothetical protein